MGFFGFWVFMSVLVVCSTFESSIDAHISAECTVNQEKGHADL